jgi:hypothetical protein
MIITQISYIDYLNSINENENNMTKTLVAINKNEIKFFSIIKVKLTRNELAACLAYHINSNILQLIGISEQRLCNLIEQNCCDIDGKEFNTLKTILNDFKNGNRNPNVAFESYLNKLNKTST